MPASLIEGGILRARLLHEPLGELNAASVRVESHHEAVVVDALDLPSGLVAIGAAAGCDGDVTVDCHGRVRGLVGARLVSLPGLVLPFAQPRVDYGHASSHRLVVWVIADLGILCEQVADLLAVI